MLQPFCLWSWWQALGQKRAVVLPNKRLRRGKKLLRFNRLSLLIFHINRPLTFDLTMFEVSSASPDWLLKVIPTTTVSYAQTVIFNLSTQNSRVVGSANPGQFSPQNERMHKKFKICSEKLTLLRSGNKLCCSFWNLTTSTLQAWIFRSLSTTTSIKVQVIKARIVFRLATPRDKSSFAPRRWSSLQSAVGCKKYHLFTVLNQIFSA